MKKVTTRGASKVRTHVIVNAFRPGMEIDEPRLFAGRGAQIREVVEALHTDGAAPIIYGDRGLGKSSLARQSQLIAMGDMQLLEENSLREWAFSSSDAFLTFYVTCSADTPDTKSVLRRLNNSMRDLELAQADARAEQLVERQTGMKVSLKLVEAEVIRRYAQKVSAMEVTGRSEEETLLDLASALSATTGQRILLIIDELDRLHDSRGLASLVKTASSRNLRFALVGIGSTISELLADHRSLERVGVPVRALPMSVEELEGITDRAVRYLGDAGLRFRFTDESRQLLARMASGFPWFVHVLGQAALISAFRNGEEVVASTDVVRIVRALNANRFAQQFSDMYQTAVQESWQREVVLRALAKWPGGDIPTGAIYPVCRAAGVGNPSLYRGHLSREKYGRILLIPPFQRRGMVRFANQMFRVYINLRSSIFRDIKARVDDEWRQLHTPGAE